MPESPEPILKRLHQLNSIINGSGIDCQDSASFINVLAKDGLLDALVVLYDECNNDALKKNDLISTFIKKYRRIIQELRRLRVNLNDFEQKKIIGKGHFGVVQLVREKLTNNLFALKTLQKAETLSQRHVTFYEEERDIMAKSTSPWITRLQYAFQDENNLYLLMEFHPGGDLLSLLDRYNYIFTEEMAKFYLAEICIAIHAVHSMGYVHRDVKPDNILIDRCGHIKLADFGSAAKMTTSKIVRSEMPVGTPDYIAPEILASTSKGCRMNSSYGVECDFWSVGIMAYEMLYGETPFKGENSVATYSNILNHEKMLKFPDENSNQQTHKVSESSKRFITELLANPQTRLTYSGIVKHMFFLHTDWNNLESVEPPFIPVLSSNDDTSNFEEFDSRPVLSSTRPFQTKTAFSGFDLPFIGFTYVRPNNGEDIIERDLPSGVSHSDASLDSEKILQLTEELQVKKKALHKAQLEIKTLNEETQRRPKLNEMEKRAVKAEERVVLIERELETLQQESILKYEEIQSLKKKLTSEKKERTQTEAKALEFLKKIKLKWKKDQEEKINHLTEKVNMYSKAAEALRKDRDEMLQQLTNLVKKLELVENEALKYKLSSKDYERKLQKLTTEINDPKCAEQNGEDIKKLEKIQAELNDSKNSYTHLFNECEALTKDKSELNLILKKKENELNCCRDQLQRLNNEIKKLEEREKYLQVKNEEKKETAAREKSQIQVLELRLNQEFENSIRLRMKLDEVLKSLDDSMVTQSSFVSQQEALENKLKCTEKELFESKSAKDQLINELSILSSREDEQQIKIRDLESVLVSLRQTVNELETRRNKIHGDNSLLKAEAQLELFEKQLKECQESAASDREKLHLTEDNLKKAQKELSNLKLDLRSAERELKQSQDTVQFLRERSKENRDQLNIKEDEVKSWREKVSQSEDVLHKKEEEIMILKCKENEFYEEKQSFLVKLETLNKEKDLRMQNVDEFRKQITHLQNEIDAKKFELERTEKEIENVKREKENEKLEKLSLKDTIKNLELQLADSKKVIMNLKEVCSEQDQQLSAIDKFEEKLETLSREKERLKLEIQNLQSELKICKTSCNEEKSLRLFQEKRVHDLEEKLSSSDKDHDQLKSNLQEQLSEIKEENYNLCAQINDLEKEIYEASLREKQLNHNQVELQNRLKLIEGEVEGHIKHIYSLKESNFKLSNGLEESISKGELHKEKIIELEANLKQHKVIFEEKEMKMKSIHSQQSKLIDFLQSKVENPPKRKTSLAKILAGSRDKENHGNYISRHQQRRFEEVLAQEKEHSRQLAIQLARAREEIVQLKAQGNEGVQKLKGTNAEISNSPNLNSNQPKKRMKHNIPHRWQSHLMKRAGKCSGCLGSIPFSRNVVKCQDCGVIAHTKCSESIANTCGLPAAYATHCSQSKSAMGLRKSLVSEEECIIRGWVHIPRDGKARWGKHFAVLTKSELKFFDKEPVPFLKPFQVIHFDDNSLKILILHSVPSSELPYANESEFPFILKVEIQNGEKDDAFNPIYMMMSSFEEKQSWVFALEGVLHDRIVKQEEEEEEKARGTLECDTLISLNSVTPIDVNTVVYLNQSTVLVGAMEGLFSFEPDDSGIMKFKARIEGIVSVYEIALVPSLGVAVLIGGKNNNIYHTNLELLKVAAKASQMGKPSINLVSVEPEISCHLLSVSQHTKRVFLCAAACNRVSIFIWVDKEQTFEVCRQYSTQEPCSCFQFTSKSLIVGAERFYKISLKNFSIEEFLDEGDPSLAYAIFGSAQMSSFPVAIIQVSLHGKHEEYLLVFYEIGIFVDEEGRRTREFDLKFVRLPIGIVFRHPNLYILHDHSVEVIEIRPESFTKIKGMSSDSDNEYAPAARSVCKTMSKPRLLGKGLDSGSILLATSCDNHQEVVSLKASFPDDLDLSTSWIRNTSLTPQPNAGTSYENSSLTSEWSTSSDFTESNDSMSLKRTKFPNFIRASKRSKKP